MRSTVEGGPEPYVTIGTQKWQRRNLDVSIYRNGDIIPYVKDQTTWNNLTTGAWCWYNNDPEIGKIYGKLYNWYAVNDSRGLAPEGWHVPNDAEWNTLTNFLGYYAGGALKQTGTTYWLNPNTGATNSSGFSALPAGLRNQSGFTNIQYSTYWWSASEYDASNATQRALIHSYNIVFDGGYYSKVLGFSVRCIKN